MLIVDGHKPPGSSAQPCQPLCTPSSSGFPHRPRWGALRAYCPPQPAHTQQQTSSSVPSAFPGTRIGFCLFFPPSSLSQEDHRKPGCPSGPARRGRRGQRSEAGGQEPAASRISLAFSWAGAVAASPGASPALCTDGHGRASPPSCFTAFPACPSLLVTPRNEGQDGLPHGVRETEAEASFPSFPAPLAPGTRTGLTRRGVSQKATLLLLHKRRQPRAHG